MKKFLLPLLILFLISQLTLITNVNAQLLNASPTPTPINTDPPSPTISPTSPTPSRTDPTPTSSKISPSPLTSPNPTITSNPTPASSTTPIPTSEITTPTPTPDILKQIGGGSLDPTATPTPDNPKPTQVSTFITTPTPTVNPQPILSINNKPPNIKNPVNKLINNVLSIPLDLIPPSVSGNFYSNRSFSKSTTNLLLVISLILFGIGITLINPNMRIIRNKINKILGQVNGLDSPVKLELGRKI